MDGCCDTRMAVQNTPLPSLFPGLQTRFTNFKTYVVRSLPRIMVPLAPPLVSPIAAIPLALLSAYVPHIVKSAIVATTIGYVPACRARRTVWVRSVGLMDSLTVWIAVRKQTGSITSIHGKLSSAPLILPRARTTSRRESRSRLCRRCPEPRPRTRMALKRSHTLGWQLSRPWSREPTRAM